MSNIYIFSQIGQLSKNDEHFVFKDKEGKSTRLLPSQIDFIFIDNYISITAEAFRLFEEYKIPVVFRGFSGENLSFQHGNNR